MSTVSELKLGKIFRLSYFISSSVCMFLRITVIFLTCMLATVALLAVDTVGLLRLALNAVS